MKRQYPNRATIRAQGARQKMTDDASTCSICRRRAKKELLSGPSGGVRAARTVECATCGNYNMSIVMDSMLKNLSPEDRLLLSAATRNATERGETLQLDMKNTQNIIDSTPRPTPPEQMDLLLQHIVRVTGPGRTPIPIDESLAPIIYATDGQAVGFAYKELLRRKLIERAGPSSVAHFAPTMAGYERVRELEGADRSKAPATPAAELDAVTGTLPRAAFDRDMAEAMQAAEPSAPVSLVMVDVDHFKAVNDKHGHLKGDEVLREIGRRLTAVAQGKGKVYRYGGEELAMILPNHGTEEATAVAERARRTTDGEPVAEVPVTASFGVATAPEHAKDVSALIEAADGVLYQAKHTGRNRVCSAQSAAAPRRVRTLDALEPDELEELRREKLRGGTPKCPADGGILTLEDITSFSARGTEFIARCPICNKQVRLRPPIEFEVETIDESGVRTKRTEKG